MTSAAQPRPPKRRPNPIRLRVHRVDRLAPRLVRITFAGPELSRFTWPGAGSHVKVILPEAGAPDVVLPEPDAEGMVVFSGPMTMRTYTPRRFDPAAGELDIDFVVHGHGPASRWADHAAPGDRVAITIPRATYRIADDATALVLAGDESALPAIGTILATRPGDLPTTVYVEVWDAADEVDPGGGVTVRWLHRADDASAPGDLLERALAAADLPAGVHVWVACEAHVVRRIRSLLLDKHRLPREAVVTRGYWRTETENHPDHDFGEDDIPTRSAP